jgi:hypothetical protein
VPSGITPLPWVARTATHRLVLPDLQNRHSPHSAVYSGITWSPGLHAGHALAHLDDDARALVAQHHREQAFGVIAAQGERIGVADARVGDAHQHFALRGGATSISTICSGCPAKATAARDFMACSGSPPKFR